MNLTIISVANTRRPHRDGYYARSIMSTSIASPAPSSPRVENVPSSVGFSAIDWYALDIDQFDHND